MERDKANIQTVRPDFCLKLQKKEDRILNGAEAEVFAEILAGLLDETIIGRLDDYERGILCFDDLI